MAAQSGYVSVAELLVERGAAIDRQMHDGATPLFIASQNGHTALVRFLLHRGARIDHTRQVICKKNG